jgi:Zn-dependent M28 family amino/carboxypeptidase
VVGDDQPEKGSFYRSDHFEFAKRGVPGLHAGSGTLYRDRPAGWGERMRDEYIARAYHKPADEIRAEWDLSGAVEDLECLLAVGDALARAKEWPRWSSKAEFAAVRAAALGQ